MCLSETPFFSLLAVYILNFGQCTISSVNNIHRMVSVALKIVAAIIAAVLSIIIIVVIIVVATSGKDTDTGTIFLTVGQNNFGDKTPFL